LRLLLIGRLKFGIGFWWMLILGILFNNSRGGTSSGSRSRTASATRSAASASKTAGAMRLRVEVVMSGFLVLVAWVVILMVCEGKVTRIPRMSLYKYVPCINAT
jgi:hypothetical protein